MFSGSRIYTKKPNFIVNHERNTRQSMQTIWTMPSLKFEVEHQPEHDSSTVIDTQIDTQIDTIIDEPIVLSENEVTENEMTEYHESTDDDNSSVDSIIISLAKRKQNVSISASQVAQIFNLSPFGTKEDLTNKLLKKHIIGYDYVDKDALVLQELSPEGLQYHRFVLQKIKHCRESSELRKLAGKGIACIFSTEQYKNASAKTKANVQRVLLSHYRRVFGTLNEEHVAEIVGHYGKAIHKDDKTYTLMIKNSIDFQFVVSGRIDRILEREDGTRVLIEIKNRVHSFHKKLQRYESIQVQLYLQMTGLEEAFLIEYYERNFRYHKIRRDDSYYNHILRPNLIHYTEYLQKCMKGRDLH